MATKKTKSWLIYFIIIVIALVIINPLADKEIMSEQTIVQAKTKNAQSAPKNPHKIFV